jgi:prolyl-tRNA synthetase
MFLSNYFLPTEKVSDAKLISHQLMLRAGLIKQLASGLYQWLPLGLKVLKKVSNIIQEEMDRAGALEILLPSIQPISLWEESGRFGQAGDLSSEMLTMKDRHDNLLVFAPTAEEAVCDLFKKVQSYKNLPLNLYQITWKFRDEIRPRYGVMRAREFLMKDSYSFDISEKEALISYEKMLQTYLKIFKRIGMSVIPVTASSGDIGGNYSHEIHIIAEAGESTIFYEKALVEALKSDEFNLKTLERFYSREEEKHDSNLALDLEKKTSIEVGHLFYLDDKYSKAMGLTLQGPEGKSFIPKMGCYGIGVSRVIAAVIEASHDAKGIIWPEAISPFQIIIIDLLDDKNYGLELYEKLEKLGLTVIYDDKTEGPGSKLARADLIGITHQIILGQSLIKEGKIEYRKRAGEKELLIEEEILRKFS